MKPPPIVRKLTTPSEIDPATQLNYLKLCKSNRLSFQYFAKFAFAAPANTVLSVPKLQLHSLLSDLHTRPTPLEQVNACFATFFFNFIQIA